MNHIDPLFFTPPCEAPDRRRRLFKDSGSQFYKNQDRLLGVQADAALEMLNAGKPYLSGAVADFAAESKKFSDPAYEAKMVGQAGADAQQAIARNADAAKRGLERFGINPNSGRFAAMNADNIIRGAALESGAKNSARNNVERMKLAASKDFYSALVGQQSDAASQVGNVAGSFGNMGNAMANNANAETSMYGEALGNIGGWIFKDGGKVKIKRALGGGTNSGLFKTGGAGVVAPQPGNQQSNLLSSGIRAARMGSKLSDAVPNVLGKAGDALATGANPELGMAMQDLEVALGNSAVPVAESAAAGTAAADGAAAATAGAEAATAATVGAEAASTGAAAASSALAPVAAAMPWVAGALAIGSMFDMFAEGGKRLSLDDRIKRAVDRASSDTGIDRAVLHRLVQAESSGNPRAVSKAGAAGLTQLMPATARQYGVKDRHDVDQAVMGGARYLRDLMKQTNGDMIQAVAAYNWGIGNLSKHGLERAPAETRNHVRKVLGDEAAATLPPLRRNKQKRSGLPRIQAGAMTADPREEVPVRNFAPELTRQTSAAPNLAGRPESLPGASPMLPNLGETQTASPMLSPALAAAPKPSVYRIRKGDTMTGIASRLGTTVDALMAANPQIKNADVIRAGDAIRLADGGKVDALSKYMQSQGWSHGKQDKQAAYEAIFQERYTGSPDQDAKMLDMFTRMDAEDAESGKWERIDQDAAPGVRMADGGRADMTEGGSVEGPGTETSDSIQASLSDGEFVENAEAVNMSRNEVEPFVAQWMRGDGDSEDLLEAINDAGLKKRYGGDDDGERTATFLTEARDLVEGIRSLPHNEESMPVLAEAYYRLAASKPANPTDEELDAIADIKVAVAAWAAKENPAGEEIKRYGGGGVGAFFGGFTRGFNDGQAMSERYREKKQRREFEKAVGDAMGQAQDEAAKPGQAVNVLDTGAIDKADLGAGGGSYVYGNEEHAKSAMNQAKDVESLQREMDDEFAAAFNGQTPATSENGVQTFAAPTGAIESAPIQSKAGDARAVNAEVDAHNADMLNAETGGSKPAKGPVSSTGGPAVQLPDITIQEPEQPKPSSRLLPSGISLTKTKTRSRSAEDIFADKYVPRMQDMLIKQGRIKEADAFGEWAKDKQRQAYGRAWSNAAMKYMAGDVDGAIAASKDIYDRMVPDGLYAETVPGNDGQYTVNFRDENTHAVVRSHQASAADLSKLAIGALSPMEQFNAWWKMGEAEREAMKPDLKVVGNVLVNTKTGGVVFDARQDKEATGYAAELASAVKSGKIGQEKADKLYVDYLEKKATQSGGVTVNFPSQSTWETDAQGNRLAVAAGKDGGVRVVDTGVKDPEYVAKRVQDAMGEVGKLPARDIRGVDMGKLRMNVETFMRSNPGMSSTEAVQRALGHGRQYRQYKIEFTAAKDATEREAITQRYRAMGVVK